MLRHSIIHSIFSCQIANVIIRSNKHLLLRNLRSEKCLRFIFCLCPMLSPRCVELRLRHRQGEVRVVGYCLMVQL
jgi:hypothetical protein